MRRIAIVAAVLLVAYGFQSFSRAREATPSPTVVNERAPSGTAMESGVAFRPAGVTLDYRTGEMVIAGSLVRRIAARPDTVWLWAFFVNPAVTTAGSWSDLPIAVSDPFARGDSVSVEARGPFHWATQKDLPRKGFVAVTRASAVSADDAMIPTKLRDRSAPRGISVRSIAR